jgi:DNA-binding response OmpR family regulator
MDKKIKILYAEDEPALGKIVKESLESRGFEVFLETDGIKALHRFHHSGPDICVLDVMMPQKDGFTLAGEIRSIDPAIPLLFLTAKTQTEDVVKGFTLGGNDYIRKPFSMEELIVRIHNLIRHKQQKKKPVPEYRIGKYMFNPQRQTLSWNGEEKKLSFRETELLQMLAENRENILNRREILQKLWGNDSFFNSRNLDVYITRLRQYLKEDRAVEIITVKGIGYRFIAPGE